MLSNKIRFEKEELSTKYIDIEEIICEIADKFENSNFTVLRNMGDITLFKASLTMANLNLYSDDLKQKRNNEVLLLLDIINASHVSQSLIVFECSYDKKFIFHKQFSNLLAIISAKYNISLSTPPLNLSWFVIASPNGNSIDTPKVFDSISFWSVHHCDDNKSSNGKKVNLTERERQVLRLVSEGQTSMQISTILGISFKTINLHVDNSIKKLRATNRTNAVVRAMHLDLI